MKGTAWFVEQPRGPTPYPSSLPGVQGEEKPHIPAPPGAPSVTPGPYWCWDLGRTRPPADPSDSRESPGWAWERGDPQKALLMTGGATGT